jgi:hypothetical protein
LHFSYTDTDAWTRTDAKYPGVQTRVHTIDFAAADEGAYVELAGAVGALDVGVLGAFSAFNLIYYILTWVPLQ